MSDYYRKYKRKYRLEGGCRWLSPRGGGGTGGTPGGAAARV